jgi:hypothetical protein
MQSYRQRIAIQKQHIEPKVKQDPFIKAKKINREETRAYIMRAILMYKKVITSFEPFSDEEILCRNEILKYTVDLEILNRGSYEEGKEVVKKYGGIIGKTILKS